MRRYETVVILDPEMADDEIRNFTEKYSNLVRTSGGELIKIEDWGSKRLAYLVKKRDRGRYLLFDFVGQPALITELERQFKISEEVMKFLSVKIDQEVDLDAFRAAAAEKNKTIEEDGIVAPESGTEDLTGTSPAAETAPETSESAEEQAPELGDKVAISGHDAAKEEL